MLSNKELEDLSKQKLDFPRNCILINKEEFIKLKNGEKVTLNYLNYNFETQEVFASIEMLKIYIYDERIFTHFISQLENTGNPILSIGGIGEDHSHGGTFSIVVTDMIRSIKSLIDKNKLELSNIVQNRFNEYLKTTSIDTLIKKYKGQNYDLIIDNNTVSINIEDLLSILVDDMYFKTFFDKKSSGNSYKGLPKEYYAYALINFIWKENLNGKCCFSNQMLSNLQKLNSMTLIDFQSINQITEIQDKNIDNIIINCELDNTLFKDMPNNLNVLEKAIYLYIKLCKMLTYDPEFYAVDLQGKATQKHENIKRLQSITPSNNYVVCYEFNAIYEKLLSKLGLPFEINSKNVGTFGGGHASLTFRYEEFLIAADSIKQILDSDLTRAKLNQPLEGLTCENLNNDTKKQFNETVSKIYKILVDQNDNLEVLLGKYHEFQNGSSNNISLENKLNIMMEEISKTNFKEMDALSYIIQLKKIIFTSRELSTNFDISIIRENTLFEDFYAIPTVIFTMNDNGLSDTKNNKYFVYNQITGIKSVSRKFVESMFIAGKFERVSESDYLIPGIALRSLRRGDNIKSDRRI